MIKLPNKNLASRCTPSFFLVALSLFWTTSCLAAPQFSANETKILRQISTYMQNLKQASGRFVQINPTGGSVEGKFYLSRPGKMRFEYAPPATQIIIATGAWISVQEAPGQQANRFPKSATPIGLLLDNKIDLATSDYVQDIVLLADGAELILADSQKKIAGELRLFFTRPKIELRSWNVRDAQDQNIRILLASIKPENNLSRDLFFVDEIEDYND